MNVGAGDGAFPATHWTLVARLKSADEAVVRGALEDLCAQYRFPLYCVIRHRGLNHHDAEDALHDFLVKLLRLEAFGRADATKGRLRAFLCTALQRFLIDRHKAQAARVHEVSIEGWRPAADDEARYEAGEFPDHETPERLFDREWARALLARVLMSLESAYSKRGKETVFAALAPVLRTGGSLRGEDTAELAARLGLTRSGLRSTHQNFVREYGEMLESEVWQTVTTREEMEEEIAHLRSAFRKG
jgi:RNA polymerase sigma-70 factor (ECF subfamily)